MKSRAEQSSSFWRRVFYAASRAAASGGEYSITDDGRVRPKHVFIEFEK
jgi:hypothetical protein